jgi:UDP-N-acetylglucosamine:LPS N-acetylglucosamine transferase
MGKDRARNILAILTIAFTFGYFTLISLPRYTAKSDPVIIATQSALVGLVTLVLSYYFGGSKTNSNTDKTQKDEPEN